MIKDSTPSSSRSEIDDEANNQGPMVKAIERLKRKTYDNAERIKSDLQGIQSRIYDSKTQALAAKCGLVEAIARAIILLHRFNELDVAEPALKALHVYYPYSLGTAIVGFISTLRQAQGDICKEWEKKLVGITDDKELQKVKAAILFKKQRLSAMFEYAIPDEEGKLTLKVTFEHRTANPLYFEL
ncbi:hypothetical protein GQ42DRAFT_179338 [Ramicandelaber brevisporus]|nr:hypothetical protein GQ42DRAFT_179338 [Ramicandelaber brevisporus]